MLPLKESEYNALIQKRIEFYRSNPKAELPIDKEVFTHLYKITKGRLRYIFGLLTRLVNSLYLGDLTDRITLNIAKPMIAKLARERIMRNNLSPSEEYILKALVKLEFPSVTELTKEIKKSTPYVSKVLSHLIKNKLVTVKKQGRNRYYSAVLDASIAYLE